MKILIAPTAWKGILNAQEIAAIIDSTLKEISPTLETIVCAIADGGNDTLNCLVDYTKGFRFSAEVVGPFFGIKVNAQWGILGDGTTAIIEMAQAAGIDLLRPEEYDPVHATTFGVGELIKQALNHNCLKILISMGGSATIDGGLGCLQELGVMYDQNKFDLLTLDIRLHQTEIQILSDVRTPISQAVSLFGPQKGATIDQMAELERFIDTYSSNLERQFKKEIKYLPGGGAAGGLAAGLYAILDAPILSGIETVLSILEIDEKIASCDLIITGEGKLDRQTLEGKAIYGLSQHAKKYNKPIYAFVGLLDDDELLLEELGIEQVFVCTSNKTKNDAENKLRKKVKDAFKKVL